MFFRIFKKRSISRSGLLAGASFPGNRHTKECGGGVSDPSKNADASCAFSGKLRTRWGNSHTGKHGGSVFPAPIVDHAAFCALPVDCTEASRCPTVLIGNCRPPSLCGRNLRWVRNFS